MSPCLQLSIEEVNAACYVAGNLLQSECKGYIIFFPLLVVYDPFLQISSQSKLETEIVSLALAACIPKSKLLKGENPKVELVIEK